MPSPTTHGKGLNIPAVGEVFELTLTTPINAMEMVQWASYNSDDGWEYNGRVFVPGTQTFKLAQTGYQPNLDGVRWQQGKANVPQGFWLMAFYEAFPTNDGNGPIGVADASWLDPRRRARFPALVAGSSQGWLRNFLWAGSVRHGDWRWLEACK